MRALPKASKSMTKTISRGSLSWRPRIRGCCRDTAGRTFQLFPRSRFRNTDMRGRRLSAPPHGHQRTPMTSPSLVRMPVLFATAILLSNSPLFAHDFWLEPTTFSPRTGQIVGVRLRVGQDLLGDP